ncbi:MAG TPA: YciI family protein [Methylomirabilota bacterium]|nr:YciI family protein [Methylomirabilota bacterium]
MSRSERDILVGEALASSEVVRKNGQHVVSRALHSVQTATTVRIRNGKASATDSSVAETKEPPGGGFPRVEVGGLNAAIRVASKIPPARLGYVEPRPIRELTQP